MTGQQAGPAAKLAQETAWRGTLAPAAGPRAPPAGPGAGRRRAARLLREPFSQHARKERLYVLLSLPLAIAGFAFTVIAVTVGLGMSLSFAGMVLGLPLLVVSLLAARRLAAISRGLAGRLLGLRVAPPPSLRAQPGIAGWVRAGLTDPAGWRACGYLVLKLPVTVAGLAIAGATWVYGLALLTFPLWWEILHLLAVRLPAAAWPQPGSWPAGVWLNAGPIYHCVRTLPATFLLVPLGAALTLVAPWAMRAVAAVDGALVAGLLGPSLPHRVRDLEQARARAVDDSAARLRRIERDLHDGAQAQMVAVAMKLGLAREKLAGPGGATAQAELERARELVDAAHRSAREAIAELRDLVRGIHPPVLNHGLGTALATLAARR